MAFVSMTKSEFVSQANKAGVNPNIYGLIINARFPCRGCGEVTGGKVVGIAWFDEWKTREEYSPAIGKHDVTSLGKSPFVVLRKNRNTYYVDAYRINAYFRELLDEMIKDMLKKQKAESKKEKEKKTGD